MIDLHKRIVLGKIYHKLPHEFDEMSEIEFELLYVHTAQLNEKEKEMIEEKQIKTR